MSRPHSIRRYLALGLAALVSIVVLSSVDRDAEGQQAPAAPPTLTPAEQAERIARTGGSVPVESNINAALRRFEPGNKTYWHSHDGGFILFVQEGRARVQRRGEPMKELGPGEIDYAPPGLARRGPERTAGAARRRAVRRQNQVPRTRDGRAVQRASPLTVSPFGVDWTVGFA